MSDSEGSDSDEEKFPPKRAELPNNKGGNARNPRATQSMRQMPVSTPPPGVLKKSKSAPVRQLHNPMYLPQSPPPPPYGSTGVAMPHVAYPPYGAPYMPQSMYYPPVQPQTVIIRQNHAPVPYGNYDPNFEAYFGPDVRPSQPSTLAMQRDQLQNFERRRSNNSYQNRRSYGEDVSVAEARALEEAIQLSLTESSRRASRGDTNDFDSGYTSLATSSQSHHWNEDVVGDSADASARADEMALQKAIMLSLSEASSFDDVGVAPAPTLINEFERTSSESFAYAGMEYAPPPVDRQYPYNVSPEHNRKAPMRRDNSTRTTQEERYSSHTTPEKASAHVPVMPRRPADLTPPQSQYNSPRADYPTPRTDEEIDPRNRHLAYTARTTSTTTARDEALYAASNFRETPPRLAAPKAAPVVVAPPPPPQELYHEDVDTPARDARPSHLMQRDLSDRTTGSFLTRTTSSQYNIERRHDEPRAEHRSSSAGRGRPAPSAAYAEESGNEYSRVVPLRRSASTSRPYPSDREGDPERSYPRDGGAPRGGRYEDPYERSPSPALTRKPSHYDHFPSEEARLRSGYPEVRRDRPAPRSDPVDRKVRAQYESAVMYEESYSREARSSSAPRGGGRERVPYDVPAPEYATGRPRYYS